VGPDGEGKIPSESMTILAQIGEWMEKNGESIRNCGPAFLDKPEFGRITQNGNRLFVHIFENTLGALPLLGLKKEDVESLRLLDGNRPIPVSTSWVHSDYPEILFADLGEDPVLPDPVDTVLEVRLKG
jgi:alpha-L-fucosidase